MGTLNHNELVFGPQNANYRYPIDGGVAVSAVNQFPGKVTTGDTSRDSEPIASTQIWGTWEGGIGIEQMVATVHKDRVWYSSLDTRYHRQLFLPPAINSATSGAPASKTINAATAYGPVLYAMFSSNVGYSFDGTNWSSNGLTVSAQARDATSFTDANRTHWLVFAYGNSAGTTGGYTKWDGTTGTDTAGNGTTKPRAYALAVHNGYLWAMDSVGKIWKCTDLSADTWTTDGGVLPVYDHQVPPVRQLLVYPNLAGEPTLHCVTRAGLYAYDDDAHVWYATPLQYPYLSENGPFIGGATVWRGDLYIAQGLDIFRYSGGAVQNIGLNRDDGLSDLYATNSDPIRFVVNAYNWLVAATRDALFAWDGTGWHFLATPPIPATGLRGLYFFSTFGYQTGYLLEAVDADTGGCLAKMTLPISVFNPRRLGASAVYNTAGGSLITGWFDKDWSELLGTALEVVAEGEGLSTTETIIISYQIDTGTDGGTWTTLLTLNSSGMNNVPQTGSCNSGYGTDFYRIRFKVAMATSSTSLTPVLKYLRLKYLKNLPVRLGYAFTIDITPDGYDGQDAGQMWDHLYTALSATNLLDLSFRRTGQELVSRKVRVTRWAGPAYTGMEVTGKLQVAVVEV